MNPRVHTFAGLIRWIADKHHDGAVLPIAGKVGVSPALVNLWVKGDTKNPRLESLERLCAAYHLDFAFVRGLLRQSMAHPISGGSGECGPPGVVQVLEFLLLLRHAVSEVTRRRARPVHGSWCPA